MTIIHITAAEQRVPETGKAPPCKDKECPGENGWFQGFGMAGGGMGSYRYCEKCKKIVDKTSCPEEF